MLLILTLSCTPASETLMPFPLMSSLTSGMGTYFLGWPQRPSITLSDQRFSNPSMKSYSGSQVPPSLPIFPTLHLELCVLHPKLDPPALSEGLMLKHLALLGASCSFRGVRTIFPIYLPHSPAWHMVHTPWDTHQGMVRDTEIYSVPPLLFFFNYMQEGDRTRKQVFRYPPLLPCVSAMFPLGSRECWCCSSVTEN